MSQGRLFSCPSIKNERANLATRALSLVICRKVRRKYVKERQHYAQHCDCQDSDSDSDCSVENATLLDPSTLGAPLLTNEGSLQCDTAGSIDQPPAAADAADAAGIQVPASTDLDLDAGNGDIFNYSLDIGGDMGEPEPEPEVSDTHKRSALEANISIPSDPSRIEDVFEEQYPGAGCVISHGMIPFQHTVSLQLPAITMPNQAIKLAMLTTHSRTLRRLKLLTGFFAITSQKQASMLL